MSAVATILSEDEELAVTYPPTSWTMVWGLQNGDENEFTEALERLFRGYWYPLYAYSRASGNEPDVAEDLVQGFFLNLLKKKSCLDKVDPEKGRLRSYLRTVFFNFSQNELKKDRAIKRGGGVKHVSLNQPGAEEIFQLARGKGEEPTRVLDRVWAMTLLKNAEKQLLDNYGKKGQRAQAEAYRDLAAGVRPKASYKDLAKRFNTTEASIKAASNRFRTRFKAQLLEELRSTLGEDVNVDDEVARLSDFLSSFLN